MVFRLTSYVFLACFLLMILPLASQAADTVAPQAAKAEVASDDSFLQSEESRYNPININTMNKLLWALGVYNASNPEDIDMFMRISECSLYQKFYNDDITWEKIKKSMTKYLSKKRSDISWRYEYTLPATLGRYDENLSGFPLVDGTDILSVKSLEVINFSGSLESENICMKGNYGAIKFPLSIILKIKSPLTLSFIRVSKEVAEAYLDRLKVEGIAGRPIYLRIRFVVTDLDSVKGGDDKNMLVAFRGKVERIDAYADQELMLPIFGQDF